MKARLKVLVVGPAPDARGGIASVIAAHKQTRAWAAYNCEMVETFRDGSRSQRLAAAIGGYRTAFWKVLTHQIIHIHVAGESSLLRKLPIMVWARACGRPVVMHIHASGPESLFEKTPAWALRMAFALSCRIIALSPKWAELIRTRFPQASIEVIPNPAFLPNDVNAIPFHEEERKLTVLFVGKLEKRKGYHDLVRAAKLVLTQIPEARFWLAGHGEMGEAQQLTSELGISSQVQCLGWVGKPELQALLSRCSVFCLPSYDEGVPMSLLEAMSCAIPVVTTPVGGIPDVVTDDVNGLLVQPGDVPGLATALIRVLSNANRLQTRLGQAGHETVSSRYSLKAVDRQLAALYTTITR